MLFIEAHLEKQYFFVFPSGAYTNKSEGFPTHEQAIYNCLCEKYGFFKFSLYTCSDYHLKMVLLIQKSSRTYVQPNYNNV
jgi:hypothetical protein